MALRIVGGEQGQPLETTHNVLSTWQSTVAVGNLCINDNTANWTINSCADNAAVKTLGKITKLSDDSKLATVRWFYFNKVFEAHYSHASPTVGMAPIGGTNSHVDGSSNATTVVDNYIVAVDCPASGYIQWLAN